MPTTVGATGGFNLTRYTTRVLAGLKEKKLRNLPFANSEIVPFRNSIDLSVTKIVEQFLEGSGRAQQLSQVANDIPLVSGSIGEDEYKVTCFVTGYELTYKEMATSQAVLNAIGGGTVENRMASLGFRVIQEAINDWIAFGDADSNVTGFFNNPNVTAEDSAFDPYAGATTFQQQLDFINEVLIDPFRAQTRLNVGDFMIAVPDTLLGKWVNTQGNDGTTSVYDAVMRSNRDRGLMGIMSLNEARKDGQSGSLPTSIGVGGKDRIAIFVQDPEIMAYDGSSINQWPEVRKAAGYMMPLYQVVGEFILSITNCMRYVDVVSKP